MIYIFMIPVYYHLVYLHDKNARRIMKIKMHPYHLTPVFWHHSYSYLWGTQTQNHRPPQVNSYRSSGNILHITDTNMWWYILHRYNLDCILQNHTWITGTLFFHELIHVFVFKIILFCKIYGNIIFVNTMNDVLTQSLSTESHM